MVADAGPVDGREPERVAPEPPRGNAEPAAVTVSGLVLCVLFAAWVAWLVAGRPPRPVPAVVRPPLVGAALGVELLDAPDAVVPCDFVGVFGVSLVEAGCVGDDGALTGGVWTRGTVTVGVLTVGVVMLGMLTVGVVMLGVLTVPTPTDGTVTVGTVIVGTEIVGTETVGTETVGTEACADGAAEAANAPHAPRTMSARRLMSRGASQGRCAVRRRTTYRLTRPSI